MPSPSDDNHHPIVTVHGAGVSFVYKSPDGKHLQGAAAARHRACKRTCVLQMPDNAADTVPCECLQKILLKFFFEVAYNGCDQFQFFHRSDVNNCISLMNKR